MEQITFLLLRLAIGASMFGHGVVRLPKLSAFSSWMAETFEKSMLPNVLVTAFSYVLPIAEFSVGLLLLIGLFTRQASIVGSLVMIALIFGTCMIENWEALPSQLIHVAFFALLIQYVESSNVIALDNILFKK